MIFITIIICLPLSLSLCVCVSGKPNQFDWQHIKIFDLLWQRDHQASCLPPLATCARNVQQIPSICLIET